MKALCKDLKAEYEALDAIIADLDDSVWQTLTPFDEWTIHDEISHIMFGDDVALLAATDPETFKKNAAEEMKDMSAFFDRPIIEGRRMKSQQLLQSWRKIRNELITVMSVSDPKTRLPWYGPSMNARSFITARIMETWAHGQDIYDALGIHRVCTERLKHIAHLGVRTFGWTYATRKMEIPDTKIRVELESPSGESWNFGPEDAENIIRGTAEDFCLTVAQRRNVQDTDLEVFGEVAKQWMSFAQVFAGPPATPPPAGSFVRKNGKWKKVA